MSEDKTNKKPGWGEERKTIIKISRRELIIEKLFKDDSTKDVRIVAGNGFEIKCHRFILTAQSSVFRRMLAPETGMQESITGIIRMKENSEEALKHLVGYLYGEAIPAGDGDDDRIGCDVAFELFQIGHKYEIEELEYSMRNLLCSSSSTGKEDCWYSVDVVLEMYFYVKDSEEFVSLKERALGVMKIMVDADDVRLYERVNNELTSHRDALDLLWTLCKVNRRDDKIK